MYCLYRIMLIIHITITFVEKSFPKLKLIISYLRSTMCQQRLLFIFFALNLRIIVYILMIKYT